MRRWILRILIGLPLWAPALEVRAQELGLPKLEGLSAYFRGGSNLRDGIFSGDTRWVAESRSDFCPGRVPLCGWGFETHYDLIGESDPAPASPVLARKSGPGWTVQLAVGYDHLSMKGRSQVGGYELRGSLQTLPSFAVYFAQTPRPWGVYFSVGSGILKLKNFHAYRMETAEDPVTKAPKTVLRDYAVEADTWLLTGGAGLSWKIPRIPGPQIDLFSNLFAELVWEYRDFPSLSYTLPDGVDALPPDLPRDIRASGWVVNFGIEISFPKKD